MSLRKHFKHLIGALSPCSPHHRPSVPFEGYNDFTLGESVRYHGERCEVIAPTHDEYWRPDLGTVWVDNLDRGYCHWVAASNLTKGKNDE